MGYVWYRKVHIWEINKGTQGGWNLLNIVTWRVCRLHMYCLEFTVMQYNSVQCGSLRYNEVQNRTV